ncbi:PEP-CTERM sorting domain-containing protein [Duganella alba]|uniref:PEP-CTERM sorting domain-containing protein n=1 Tax=Duganella alba TaxID=2666081 RepID=UPI001E48EAE5|nr:PEP-CTERM sorting domain-containing protein [Duganella alba]
MASAHANVVEVEGAHVKFVYNTDFWGAGTAVVSGDSITFAVDPAFSLSRTVAAGGAAAAYARSSDSALTVIAKSGYGVDFGVATTYTGNFQVANGAGGNSVGVLGNGVLSGGSYANGVFTGEGSKASYGGGISLYDGASGSIGQGDTLPANGSYEALQASLRLSTSLSVGSSGTSSVALTSFGYAFQATPVAAVPEPASYGMLLGGLGLLGMVARRRRGAPK